MAFHLPQFPLQSLGVDSGGYDPQTVAVRRRAGERFYPVTRLLGLVRSGISSDRHGTGVPALSAPAAPNGAGSLHLAGKSAAPVPGLSLGAGHDRIRARAPSF